MIISSVIFCLLLASNPVSSPNPAPRIRSLSSQEYQIYSLLIHQFVTDSRRRQLSPCCWIVLDDSTADIPNGDFAALSDSAVNLVQRALIEVLLYSCPDTFQVATLMRDHTEQNKVRCALSIDSIRSHLARYSLAMAQMADMSDSSRQLKREAKREIVDTCSCHAFTFSRCGFNSTLDQALVRVFYERKNHTAHMSSSSTHEAFFIRKGVDWQLVQDRSLSNGFERHK